MDKQIILDMEKWLLKNAPLFKNDQIISTKRASKRLKGEKFTINDYIEEMIKSMFTSSRPWAAISPYFANGEIAAVFKNYNPDYLSNENPEAFINIIVGKRLGNRRIRNQMYALRPNIDILRKIKSVGNGSIDDYFKDFLGDEYPVFSYKKLMNFYKNNKFVDMGLPLTCEFLKNLGFDLPKPDSHLREFFGNKRIGYSNKTVATDEEVFKAVDALSKATKKTRQEIDLIIWAYCAEGYGEICGNPPKCNNCVCNSVCNRLKNN